MISFLKISTLPTQRWPWLLLLISTLGLEVTALYFQYALELRPCIMCIYQRTAVFGIMFACLPVLWVNTLSTRLIAYIGWGVSAIWGYFIALEHVDIQGATNVFFATCEIVPNFPSWLPLHEWLPNLFAATGDCGDINWSFMSMSMPQWMMVIFAIFSLIWFVVLLSRLAMQRRL
jgi:disulfide bond formation protein DsbB